MNDLIFSANAVLPIILLVLVGYILKKIRLLNEEFLRVGNKLVFNVLLPVLLFSNVYSIESFEEINWIFVLYAVAAVIVIFLVSVPLTLLFCKDKGQQGVIIQAVYRSNYAIIGVPLATQIFGDSGAAAASVLSAFTIPLYNILAVITLSVFNGSDPTITENPSTAQRLKKTVKGIVTNPLIIGILSGLVVIGVRSLFVANNIDFRLSDVDFLFTAIKYIASAATPLALVILGGQFEFSAIKRLKKQIIFGTVSRTAIVPAVALSVAYFVLPQSCGEYFAALLALFGTPVAVSSAIMAREMNCDGDLAGQLVVWTTIMSSFTLFAEIAIFRALGVF